MVEVTKQSLIRRINRKLAPNGMSVKSCRETSKRLAEFGEYYLHYPTSVYSELSSFHTHLNLEAYGRESDCLGADEVLVD
jgi:hypothetical protein